MKEKLKKNWLLIAIFALAIIAVSIILAIFSSPNQIDATFNIRNMEKRDNSFVMSIGEESLLEWDVEPKVDGARVLIPDGLEKLGHVEEGIRIRAVKVGKWQLKVEHENAEYAPEKEYFVCIGVTQEDAIKNCD